MRLPILQTAFLIFTIFLPINVAQSQSIKDTYEQAVDAYNAGRFQDAVNLYQQIIQLMPNFAPAYNGLGLAVNSATGDEDEAIHYFKKAISYDPQYVQSYDNLGRLYYARQDYDLAKANFEKALKISPNLLSSKMNLAWIYLLTNSNPSKAVNYFKQVVAQAPEANNFFGLGLAYFANNQRVEVLDVITNLHRLGAKDLAIRLEDTMRNNRRVALEPVTVVKDAKPVEALEAAPASNGSDSPVGVRVRLRGKLTD